MIATERFIETSIGSLYAKVDLTSNEDCCMLFWPSLFTSHILFSDAVDELVLNQNFGHLSRVVLDPPGHGKSSFTSKKLSFGDCARSVSEILDQLNFKKCIFVGCAWGGLVGIHFAAHYPNKVAALVLSNTPLKMPDGAVRNKNSLVVSIWKTVGCAKWLAKATIKALLGPKAMKANPVLKSRMTTALQSFSSHDQMVAVVDHMLLHPEDVRDLLPTIQCRILFIAGQDDSLNPPKKHTKHVLKYFSTSNPPPLVTIQNSGHMTPLDHPKEFAAETANFLRNITGI